MNILQKRQSYICELSGKYLYENSINIDSIEEFNTNILVNAFEYKNLFIIYNNSTQNISWTHATCFIMIFKKQSFKSKNILIYKLYLKDNYNLITFLTSFLNIEIPDHFNHLVRAASANDFMHMFCDNFYCDDAEFFKTNNEHFKDSNYTITDIISLNPNVFTEYNKSLYLLKVIANI